MCISTWCTYTPETKPYIYMRYRHSWSICDTIIVYSTYNCVHWKYVYCIIHVVQITDPERPFQPQKGIGQYCVLPSKWRWGSIYCNTLLFQVVSVMLDITDVDLWFLLINYWMKNEAAIILGHCLSPNPWSATVV